MKQELLFLHDWNQIRRLVHSCGEFPHRRCVAGHIQEQEGQQRRRMKWKPYPMYYTSSSLCDSCAASRAGSNSSEGRCDGRSAREMIRDKCKGTPQALTLLFCLTQQLHPAWSLQLPSMRLGFYFESVFRPTWYISATVPKRFMSSAKGIARNLILYAMALESLECYI